VERQHETNAVGPNRLGFFLDAARFDRLHGADPDF
jgi:hypothetical protein